MKMAFNNLMQALKDVDNKHSGARLDIQALAEHFYNAAIIVPNPGYGNIVHDLPENYCFPTLKKIFDRKLNEFTDFFETSLKQYYIHKNLDSIPYNKKTETDFFWENHYFPMGDARSLYALLAHFKPSKLIEMGCGNSTKMARKAITDFSLPTKIISIDPTPRAEIKDVTDIHIQESITDIPPSFFETLEAGDVLFIDGSHVAHCGTDVPHYALNILPMLKKGVIVHIHDIFLPWEYHETFRGRHYNEQYVIAPFITCEASWKLLWPVAYVQKMEITPQGTGGGGSMWLIKK